MVFALEKLESEIEKVNTAWERCKDILAFVNQTVKEAEDKQVCCRWLIDHATFDPAIHIAADRMILILLHMPNFTRSSQCLSTFVVVVPPI